MREREWAERFWNDLAPGEGEALPIAVNAPQGYNGALDLARRLQGLPFQPDPTREAQTRARLLTRAQALLPARQRRRSNLGKAARLVRGAALAALVVAAIFAFDWLLHSALPQQGPGGEPTPTASSSTGRTEVLDYRVQTGDTLSSIADRFGLQAATILWANGDALNDDPALIQPGLVLKILPVDGAYYRWQSGDRLDRVAAAYGVLPEDILTWPANHLDPLLLGGVSGAQIPAGTWLVIPGGRPPFIGEAPVPSPLPTATPSTELTPSGGSLTEVMRWGEGTARSLAYLAGGDRLALVSTLGVTLYDAATREALATIPGEPEWRAAAVSPDGAQLAWSLGALVEIRKLPGGEPLRSYLTGNGVALGLRFSPDGSLLAVLVRPPGDEVYNTILELVRVSDAALVGSWDLGAAWDVSFAPDGGTLYAWHPMRVNGVLRWRLPDGRALATPEMFADSLAPSPDGRTFAVGRGGGVIEIRDTAGGSLIRSIAGPPEANARVLAFSGDGSILASLYSDRFVRAWRAADGELIAEIPSAAGGVPILAIAPDGSALAFQTAEGIAFHRIRDGALLGSLPGNLAPVSRAAFDPRGERVAALLASGDGGGSLAVFRAGQPGPAYISAQPGATCLGWSPDGRQIALGFTAGYVGLLRASDGVLVGTPAPADQTVQDLAFSPDGAYLAYGSLGRVDVWDLAGWKAFLQLYTRGGWVDRLAYSRDGRLLAALGLDGRVSVWRAADGAPLWEGVIGEDGYSGWLAFTPDGAGLAVASHSSVSLLDPLSGARLATHDAGGWITALSLSPGGDRLALGLSDGAIRILRRADWTLEFTAPGHAGAVNALDFTPDGLTLLSGGADGTLRTWALPD